MRHIGKLKNMDTGIIGYSDRIRERCREFQEDSERHQETLGFWYAREWFEENKREQNPLLE